jgi:4-carboxymuconolactone decarboxylase
MQYGRLSWLLPDKYSAEQRQVYETIVGGPRSKDAGTLPATDADGRLYGPFTPMLANPRIADIVQMLGAALRYEVDLTPRAREIATLAVAAGKRSNFEWFAHELLAKRAGLTAEELEHLLAGRSAPSFNAYEDLVWRVVTALVQFSDLDDSLFAEARAILGDIGIVDLVALVGHYELLSRSLRVWRIPLPEGAEEKFPHP